MPLRRTRANWRILERTRAWHGRAYSSVLKNTRTVVVVDEKDDRLKPEDRLDAEQHPKARAARGSGRSPSPTPTRPRRQRAHQLNKLVMVLLSGRSLRSDGSGTPGPPDRSILLTRSHSCAVRRQLMRDSRIRQRVEPTTRGFAAPSIGRLPQRLFLMRRDPKRLQTGCGLGDSSPKPPRVTTLTSSPPATKSASHRLVVDQKTKPPTVKEQSSSQDVDCHSFAFSSSLLRALHQSTESCAAKRDCPSSPRQNDADDGGLQRSQCPPENCHASWSRCRQLLAASPLP